MSLGSKRRDREEKRKQLSGSWSRGASIWPIKNTRRRGATIIINDRIITRTHSSFRETRNHSIVLCSFHAPSFLRSFASTTSRLSFATKKTETRAVGLVGNSRRWQRRNWNFVDVLRKADRRYPCTEPFAFSNLQRIFAEEERSWRKSW